MERRNAMRHTKTDSPINCRANWFFVAPATFRTPTSLALSDARAVVRLIKLKQAIKSIKMAMREKIYTFLILTEFPPFRVE